MNIEDYGRVIFAYSDSKGAFTLTKMGGERTRLRSLKIGLLSPAPECVLSSTTPECSQDLKPIGMIDIDFFVRDDDEIITKYDNQFLAIGINYNKIQNMKNSKTPIASVILFSRKLNQTVFAYHVDKPENEKTRLFKIVDLQLNVDQELVYMIGQFQGQFFGKSHFQRWERPLVSEQIGIKHTVTAISFTRGIKIWERALGVSADVGRNIEDYLGSGYYSGSLIVAIKSLAGVWNQNIPTKEITLFTMDSEVGYEI